MPSQDKPTGHHRRTSSGLCPNSPLDRSEGGVISKKEMRKIRREKRQSLKELAGLVRSESPDKDDDKHIQEENDKAQEEEQVCDAPELDADIKDADVEDGDDDMEEEDEILFRGRSLALQGMTKPITEATHVWYHSCDRAPKPGSSSAFRLHRPGSPYGSDGGLTFIEELEGNHDSLSSLDGEEGGVPLYGWSDDEEKPAPVEGKGKAKDEAPGQNIY
ncbi:hypothetical protein ACJ41O_011108 [Fusarium nematophilum]